MAVHSPTLRGEVLAGRDKGSVAFGSAESWWRAHGGGAGLALKVQEASAGAAPTFSDARGSLWRLTLHRNQPAAVPMRRAA